MSLSLGPAFLASIAFAIDSVEATPRLWRAEIEKRAEFANAPTTSTKKSSTTKKKTTTKKASSTKKTSSTAKSSATSAIQSSVSATPASSSSAIVPSAASSIIPASSIAGTSVLNSIQPSSTGNNLIATSAAASNNSNNGGGISGGAIGGIVAAIVIIIAGAAAYFVIARKRKNRNNTRSMSAKPDPFTMGFGSDQAFQPQMQHNQPMMTDNYQAYNSNQPGLAVSPNTAPYYPNNSASTQFHEANTQFAPDAMSPPASVPQQPVQLQNQQQYQPQLQPHIQPYADVEHTQVNPNTVAAAAAVATTAAAVTPAPASTRLKPTQSGSLGVFFVVATYTPTLSDEIDIQTGDQVEILVEYDDGWCQGINLTRGNAKGVFPKHCIESNNNDNSDGNSDNEADRVKRVSSMYMA